MKRLAVSVAFVAAALALPSVANAEWYAGAAYTQYDLEDAEVGGVTGRLGYKFSPNLAVEGEGTFGVSDDDFAELDNAYGVYGVGILPIGSSGFEVFGRVGYQAIEIDGTGPVADVDEDGLGYGAGISWNVAENVGLRADYTRLQGEDDDTDAISLGGTVNF